MSDMETVKARYPDAYEDGLGHIWIRDIRDMKAGDTTFFLGKDWHDAASRLPREGGEPVEAVPFYENAECGRCSAKLYGGKSYSVPNNEFSRVLVCESCAYSKPAEQPAPGIDLSERQKLMDSTELALRRKIHFMENHNQYFFRCESAWCNPGGCPHGLPSREFCETCRAEGLPASEPQGFEEWEIIVSNDNHRIVCGEQVVDIRFYQKGKGHWRIPTQTDNELVEKIVRLLNEDAALRGKG